MKNSMKTIEYWHKLSKRLGNPTHYPSKMNLTKKQLEYENEKRLSMEGKIEILVPQRDNYVFVNEKEVKPIKK